MCSPPLVIARTRATPVAGSREAAFSHSVSGSLDDLPGATVVVASVNALQRRREQSLVPLGLTGLQALLLFFVGITFGLWPPSVCARSWKIPISRAGLYTLDAAAAEDVPIRGKLEQMSVQCHGHEIPVDAETDGASVFFYAEPAPTPYSSSTTYWLCEAQGKPVAYPTRAATPPDGALAVSTFRESLRAEVQAYYYQQMPNAAGKDHWFWKLVMLKQPAKLPLKCLGLVEGAPAKLTIALHGVSYLPATPDHHISFAINGHSVGEATWDGNVPYVFQADVPAGVLVPGDNEVEVSAVEDKVRELDLVLVDYLVVDYTRALTAVDDALTFTLGPDVAAAKVDGFATDDIEVLDITNPLAPVKLTGTNVKPDEKGFAVVFAPGAEGRETRFYAVARSAAMQLPKATLDRPSNLRAQENRADYIIIAPREFHQALQPLVELHEKDGLTVVTVDVQDIYDEFSYGDFTPLAIRDFIAYAKQRWAKPAPRFVLLVGDATYDYRDYRGRGERSYVPTYMADTKPHGQVASDSFFACVEGDDLVPDIAVGRLPARTPEDVAAAVTRITSYAEGASPGDWERRALLVADDDDPLFEQDCDRLAALFETAGLQVTKLYLREQPSVKQMTAALMRHLSDGNLFTVYVGHAEPRSWARERILQADQIEKLEDGKGFTFVATFTCLDGAFQMMPEPCMAESFTKLPVGGAIACFSPTGLGYPDQHDVLARALFGNLLKNSGQTIGEAVMQAEQEALAERPDLDAIVQMYILFGDPALTLRIGGQG